MRWPSRCVLVVAIGFAAVLNFRVAAADKPVKHVVLVSIDGLAASYLDDPRANLPTLRKLRKEGATAKGMITSFPSVTWPSHTSLITGVQPARHGVIGNNVWLRSEERALAYIGDPERTKDQAVRVGTLYDAAHQSSGRARTARSR
jgi:predicted AlkP superfamily pyrophosphatase or phosphodiesterase